jgi:hypothetical protein
MGPWAGLQNLFISSFLYSLSSSSLQAWVGNFKSFCYKINHCVIQLVHVYYFLLYYLKLCILLLWCIAIEDIFPKYCWHLSTTWHKTCRWSPHCEKNCRELEHADYGACKQSSWWFFGHKCYCVFKCWIWDMIQLSSLYNSRPIFFQINHWICFSTCESYIFNGYFFFFFFLKKIVGIG